MSFLKNQKKIKGAELFIKCLEEEGVEYIFGLPGEENLDFLECLCKSNKIKLILTRHEQGAGFMAATYGRLTGKAGVCLTTLGPGATNLVTSAAYAQLGGMPLVMITGQKPIKNTKQGKFQILDVVDLMHDALDNTHGIKITGIVVEKDEPTDWKDAQVLTETKKMADGIADRNKKEPALEPVPKQKHEKFEKRQNYI